MENYALQHNEAVQLYETVDRATISTESAQYLYSDGDTFHFMNPESFEQFEISADLVGDNAGYMKEGDSVSLQFFEGRAINVELPKNVPLKVTYTEHAV